MATRDFSDAGMASLSTKYGFSVDWLKAFVRSYGPVFLELILQVLDAIPTTASPKKAKDVKTKAGQCDCTCCANVPVLAAATILNDSCCACCTTDCTPAQQAEAVAKARVQLLKALIELGHYTSALGV